GRRAQRYMDAGEYVPDEITNDMVRDRLAREDAAEGFLLDGYPRTLDQVRELDSMLEASGLALDAVVELTADDEVVVQRLLGRAAEQGRADDTDVVIRRRLEVYHEQTAPLADHYAGRDLLVRVDGIGTVDEVTARLLAALNARRFASASSTRPRTRSGPCGGPGSSSPTSTTPCARRRHRACPRPSSTRSPATSWTAPGHAPTSWATTATRPTCASPSTRRWSTGSPGRGCCRTGTSSPSTAAPSSTAGTGTPPSPSSWGRATPRTTP